MNTSLFAKPLIVTAPFLALPITAAAAEVEFCLRRSK